MLHVLHTEGSGGIGKPVCKDLRTGLRRGSNVCQFLSCDGVGRGSVRAEGVTWYDVGEASRFALFEAKAKRDAAPTLRHAPRLGRSLALLWCVSSGRRAC